VAARRENALRTRIWTSEENTTSTVNTPNKGRPQIFGKKKGCEKSRAIEHARVWMSGINEENGVEKMRDPQCCDVVSERMEGA
jgi:hypothetical protein